MTIKSTDWVFPKTTDEMEERFPIVQDMKDCAQSPEYHGEGDVWSHTKMVIGSMQQDPEWQKLQPCEKEVLKASAFYHDIAKPKVSEVEDGVIRAKRHSTLGARMAREMLWNPALPDYYAAPWDIREYIANLVMLHMLPFHFINKENPVYNIGASSYVVDNKHLAILARADTNGRIQPRLSRTNALDTIELFCDFCQEKDCFESPMGFQSDNARFRFFFEHKGDPCLDYYEEQKGKVIIMSALQGSGKDYTIGKNYSTLPMTGFDNVRNELKLKFGKQESLVQRQLKERTKVFMRTGQDFVFNATNTIKDVRATWIRRFRKYGYRIKIHYIEKPLKETMANNRNRDAIVPEEVIYEKFSRLDIPTALECHELERDV